MYRRPKGYTLVELMITVAVLSVLAMLAIPAYQGYISTGRQATARANIEPLRIAIEDYHLDNMATGYAAVKGKWKPGGGKDNTLESGVLGWKPDGDRGEYEYDVTPNGDGTGYTITVTPIGHTSDAQTFTK